MIGFEKHCDVLIAGGGIAGVAAALQSARCGKKTILVEKTVLLGGLATSGLINLYQALCDGNGTQVTFGISEELLHRSILYGPGDIPANWRNEQNAPEDRRFTALYSPASMVLALDEVLREAGVDVWFDTLVCNTIVENGIMTGIVVENESGRGIIHAQRFVDSTGSALLLRRSGTEVFDENNFLSLWELEFNQGKLARFIGGVSCTGKVSNLLSDKELEDAGISRAILEQERRGISGRTVSEYIQSTRAYLLERYKKLYRSGNSDRHTHYPVKLPIMPQFRKICAIHSKYVLDSADAEKEFDDSVGVVADWRVAGTLWEIPYSCLIPAQGPSGVLASGRCLGAVNDAWEVTRVIQAATLTGQVAGLASSLSIDRQCLPEYLENEVLQPQLSRLGFKIHIRDIRFKSNKIQEEGAI